MTLSKRYDPNKQLLDSAYNGEMLTVQRCLNDGADIEALTKWRRRTALHLAAMQGHVETVQLLLDAGADTNAQDDGGWTALQYARILGHAKTAKLILNKQDSGPYGWRIKTNDEISLTRAVCGRELTEVFDFVSQERITFSRHIKSGAEGICQSAFNDIPDQRLHEAAVQLLQQGGNDHTKPAQKEKQAVKIGL